MKTDYDPDKPVDEGELLLRRLRAQDEEADRAGDAYAYSKGFFRGRPRGRPALPPSERTRQYGCSLTDKEAAQARKLGGDGNLSRGIRRALELVRLQEAASLQAIADAAQSRDQTALEPGQACGLTDASAVLTNHTAFD
jgi:hypothetical protein